MNGDLIVDHAAISILDCHVSCPDCQALLGAKLDNPDIIVEVECPCGWSCEYKVRIIAMPMDSADTAPAHMREMIKSKRGS